MTDGWFYFVCFAVIVGSFGLGEYLKWRQRR